MRRRWFYASAVTILVLVAGLSTLGVASPAAIEFPDRSPGDVLIYKDEAGTETAWEMLLPGTWKTADGEIHHVEAARLQVSRVRAGSFEAFGHSYAFVTPDGARPVAASQGGSAGVSSSTALLGTSTEYAFDTSSDVMDGAAITPCGLFHALADDGQAMLAVGCTADRLPLRGIESWQGSDVYVYAAGEEAVWMRPDLPYPVRIIESGTTQDLSGIADMDKIPEAVEAPGDARPLPGVDADGDDIIAAFDYRQWAARDVVHAADADLTFTAYHEWHNEHPDAVVRSVAYEVDGEEEQWNIRWADASGGILLMAHRGPSGADPTLVALGLADEYEDSMSVIESGPGLDSDPKTWHGVPDLEQLTSAWQAYMGSEDTPTALSIYALDMADGMFVARVEAVSVTPLPPMGLLEEAPPQHYEAQGFGLEHQADAVTVTWTHAGRGTSQQGIAMPTSEAQAHQQATVPPATYGLVIGSAALAGAVIWLLAGLKSLPFAGLFSRRTRENPTRSKIRRLVAAQPGIHYQAIIQTTGLGNGAVEHHLRRLVQDGELVAQRANGYACYFVPGIDRTKMAQAALTKSPGASKVLAAIRASPGSAVADVTAETGLSPGTVSHHLKKLRDGGLVESWRDGRSVRLRAA